MDPDLAAWNALRSTPGIGPKRLIGLVVEMARAKRRAADLLDASPEQLEGLGLSAPLASAASQQLQHAHAPPAPSHAQVLHPHHDDYPIEGLDPRLPLPVVFYGAGNLSLLRVPGIAIAGSRSASLPALEFVQQLTPFLVKEGWNVVSGHAAGIDEAAHQSALHSDGTTTVVLAEGLARFRSKPSLRGFGPTSMLIVSEFAPEDEWTPRKAMQRNGFIAALSDAVVVVSASHKTGGSWAQAELCLRSGKTLLVPDFPEEIAPGNRALIDKGAIPIDPSDPASVLDHPLRSESGIPEQLGLLG